MTLLCPNHVQKTPAMLPSVVCTICDTFEPGSEFVWCSSCNGHFHANCMEPPIQALPVLRAGYQCPDCKTCQVCVQPCDDMYCATCNKAFHLTCAKPFGLNADKTEWKCKTCRVCGDCGARTAGNGNFSRWHANFTVCDSCYQLRNKGLYCPICRKAYRAVMQKEMASCKSCMKHVHKMCDPDADIALINSKTRTDPAYEYNCEYCRTHGGPVTTSKFGGSLSNQSREDSSEGFTHDSSLHSDQDSLDTNDDSNHSGTMSAPPRRTSFTGEFLFGKLFFIFYGELFFLVLYTSKNDDSNHSGTISAPPRRTSFTGEFF